MKIVISVLMVFMLVSCKSIVKDTHTIVEDVKSGKTTTTIERVEDTSFTLGTKGFGEYYLIQVKTF